MVLSQWMLDCNTSGEGVYFKDAQYTVEANGIEKNMRCSKHGFAVKKMGSCQDFTLKT